MVAPNVVSREQAYLSALATQPKDIDPDRIYEVCPTVPATDTSYEKPYILLKYLKLNVLTGRNSRSSAKEPTERYTEAGIFLLAM